jgi:hypothetical protein
MVVDMKTRAGFESDFAAELAEFLGVAENRVRVVGIRDDN